MGEREKKLELINQWFGQSVPHNRALGLRAVDFFPDGLLAELPPNEQLVGNPELGILHGGVITSFIDAACGSAVLIRMRRAMRIATLDLRIDYLKPGSASNSVLCRATCFKVTRQVAFVRAEAYHNDANDPIASAAGSFMLFSDGKSTFAQTMARAAAEKEDEK